jgi:hypothetical protein
MQIMYEALQQNKFELIAIHVGPLENNAITYLHNEQISFNIVIDDSLKIQGWDVPALPISYLVDPKGYVIHKALGPREWPIAKMRQLMLLD